MKKVCLIISLIGLLSLLITTLSTPPIKINSEAQIAKFPPNQQFVVEGRVIKETQTKYNKILQLNNNFQLSCPLDCPPLLNKNISAIAESEFYNDKYSLKILKLSYKK
ncbi:MAG: hypothetical protein AABX83_00965 [Nanoarchaeota archaeon]